MLKLLTRLFDPLEGTIRIDGYDIAKVDLYSYEHKSVLSLKTAFI